MPHIHDNGEPCEHDFRHIEAEPPMAAVEPEGDMPWLYEGLWSEGHLVRKSWVIQPRNPPHVQRLLDAAQLKEPNLPWERAELIGENLPPYPAGLSAYFAVQPPTWIMNRFGAPISRSIQWWDHWSIKLPDDQPVQLKLYDVGARAEKCWPDLPPSASIIYGISKVYGEGAPDEWGVYWESRHIPDIQSWASREGLRWPCRRIPAEPAQQFGLRYDPKTMEPLRLTHFRFVNERSE